MPQEKPKEKKENWLKKYFRNIKKDSKTQVVTIIVVALLVVAVILIYYFISDSELKFGNIFKEKKEVEEEVVNARRLDGVIVEKGKENPYPVAVMIENLTTVRPQSGLSAAGVVYEALAEGGIPRFMAVFPGAGHIPKIGPVRSSRAYYLEWQSEYDALYVFSGAYPPVLAAISGLGIKNINAMYAAQYFWRDTGQSAPHNLYTKSELLLYALRDKKLEGNSSTYKPWKFKDDEAEENRPEDDKSIIIYFSSEGYKVEYRYDRESNSYLRFNGGVEHTDRNTSEQLKAKNVVVVRVPANVIDNEGRLEMDVTGGGEAVMFTDGESFHGTWKKPSRTERTIFYHDNGEEHEFARGQTWVEIVPPEKKVEYN